MVVFSIVIVKLSKSHKVEGKVAVRDFPPQPHALLWWGFHYFHTVDTFLCAVPHRSVGMSASIPHLH